MSVIIKFQQIFVARYIISGTNKNVYLKEYIPQRIYFKTAFNFKLEFAFYSDIRIIFKVMIQRILHVLISARNHIQST